MTEIAYDAWYFLPLDSEPTQGREVRAQPPLMTSMAVDAGSSLAFRIKPGGSVIHLSMTVTGLSAEGRGENPVEIYVGEQIDGEFSSQSVTWERSQDGANAVLHGQLSRAGSIIKLRVSDAPALVVTKMEFATP